MDKRQVQIIRDINNKQLVLINDIVFCGRQSIKHICRKRKLMCPNIWTQNRGTH